MEKDIEIFNDCCVKTSNIKNERILIFGGSGSLGKETISRWINDNYIINFSRDEEKQWQLQQLINNNKLTQIIGDISSINDVENIILKTKPTLICIFACLKHIEICEKSPDKAISINVNGIINVYNTLLKYKTDVKNVLYVSTDKACLPITTYGCTKSIAEFFLQNIKMDNDIKWVGVRYGNILNSSGSIIQYLKYNSNNDNSYKLIHPDMTRFIMTLEHSVNLIEHAIINGKNNEIIVPKIYSMKIKDLFDIFENKYNKKTIISGLRCKEKINEDLISEIESKSCYINNNYYHIYNKFDINNNSNNSNNIKGFDSSMTVIDKELLKKYLIYNNFL